MPRSLTFRKRATRAGLVLALLGLTGLASARTPDADALFNWAESTYGQFFPGHPANETFPPYVFRHYSNGNYLAMADEKVYLLGPLTANQLTPLGTVTQFSCLVYPGDCASTGSAADLSDVQTLFQSFNAMWANGVPANGAAVTALTDGCYLHNGATKAMDVATVDGDYARWAGANAYRVGAVRTNASIRAVRNSTNGDGSARREIDVQYDIRYADGTTDSAVLSTLISGSSYGSCATAQTASTLRWFGNRRLAHFEPQGRNLVLRAYKLADGSLISTTLRREIGFHVKDPAGVATYAVVSGAGPRSTSGTQTLSFSIKLLSPRVMRSDPAVAGKRGNYTNWLDTDSFRVCRSATSTASNAALADCAGQGAHGWAYGVSFNPATQQLAASDTSFNGLGFGGSYTVKLYNDDGWKTINGHADKTPVATYTTELTQLPYTFASLASASDPAARYAAASMSPDTAGVAALLRSGAAGQVNLQWSPPVPPDGTAFRLSELGEYFEGPLAGGASATVPPGQRWYVTSYPATTSTQAAMPITAAPATITGKTYGEVDIWYSNRNGARIGLIHTFQ